MDNELKKEEYVEKCCCCDQKGTIPTDRVLDRLDGYFACDDYAGAERHLRYWMAEAEQLGDEHGLLLVMNECVGFYRKRGDRDSSLGYAKRVTELAARLGLDESVTMATALINAATAHCAFGEHDAALPLYDRARALYERLLPPTDERMGGLYNNMALAVMETGDYAAARELFFKALGVVGAIEGGEPSCAITYCNLADLAAREHGEIDGEGIIGEYLEKAMAQLDSVSDRTDGAYAYACEKCAPTFGHYGYFIYEKQLAERARSIYAGN